MICDVLIIGGGPAGLSAAIYASRAKFKTILLEKQGSGGLMALTDNIENYPGFDGGINGFELAVKMEAQARSFGAEIIFDEVIEIMDLGATKRVKTANREFESKAAIIAAGTSVKKTGMLGEDNFIGKGISFCAVCDAPFYRDKTVGVIGGGDSAVQEALYLAKFAKKVFLIHRRNSLRAAKFLQEKLFANEKITAVLNSVPIEIAGAQKVEKLKIRNVLSGEERFVDIDGLFIFIGMSPNSAIFSFLPLDANGYIVAGKNMETSVAGIFAAGDIRNKDLRQVSTAVSDGAVAAVSAERYIDSL